MKKANGKTYFFRDGSRGLKKAERRNRLENKKRNKSRLTFNERS